MKALTTVITTMFVSTLAHAASVCPTTTLNNYLGASPFACTESTGQITATYNNEALVPSYLGLNVLSSSNSAAAPSSITVTPENLGFTFTSADFSESGLLGAQAELVHFQLDSGTQNIDSVKLDLINPHTSAGLGIGLGAIVGQEVLCLGGQFLSLPTGLVTSLVGNPFGCTGAAVMGTVGAQAGLLSAITGLVLPAFLDDNITLDLSSFNVHEVDVIKLQAVIAAVGGSASDAGFGNSYTLSPAGSATPEPGSSMMMLAAGVLLAGNKFIVRLFKSGRRNGSAV